MNTDFNPDKQHTIASPVSISGTGLHTGVLVDMTLKPAEPDPRLAHPRRARGGWLFGMAFGFALWAAGAVFLLALVSNGRLPAGAPATGVFLSLVLWGGALGGLLPFVHRRLHLTLDDPGIAERLGPSLAARRP